MQALLQLLWCCSGTRVYQKGELCQQYRRVNLFSHTDYIYMHVSFQLSEKDSIPTKPLTWMMKMTISLIFLFTCSRAHSDQRALTCLLFFKVLHWWWTCSTVQTQLLSFISLTTFLKRLALRYFCISKNLLIPRSFIMFLLLTRIVGFSHASLLHSLANFWQVGLCTPYPQSKLW